MSNMSVCYHPKNVQVSTDRSSTYQISVSAEDGYPGIDIFCESEAAMLLFRDALNAQCWKYEQERKDAEGE